MSEKITRITSILLWALLGITVIFAILFYVGSVVPGTEGTRYEEPTITNSFIVFAYILLGLTILALVGFALRNYILNPKGLRGLLVALGVAVVLVALAALLADNTVLDLPHYKGSDNIPRTLFWTDIGLFVAYFLLAGAFLTIIYSVVSKYFKK